ncbi:Hypothetical_protein [Hexamita inflata]|uniref:Hypothetical_protein n=1 Tax=Hexamita inflata TaxID=28002 RepID=A0AA86U5I4_9EUKA|nr:Hypothetical protein HINF_LOCUS31185 [Hexamita inflata]
MNSHSVTQNPHFESSQLLIFGLDICVIDTANLLQFSDFTTYQEQHYYKYIEQIYKPSIAQLKAQLSDNINYIWFMHQKQCILLYKCITRLHQGSFSKPTQQYLHFLLTLSELQKGFEMKSLNEKMNLQLNSLNDKQRKERNSKLKRCFHVFQELQIIGED